LEAGGSCGFAADCVPSPKLFSNGSPLIRDPLCGGSMRASLATIAISVIGCQTPSAVVGIRPGNYRIDDAESHWYRDIVISDEPIDLELFHPETRWWADRFDREYGPTVCSADRSTKTPISVDEIALAFSKLEALGRGRYRIRLLETHHYWSWMDVQQNGEDLVGSFQSKGFGGPHKREFRASRVSDPNPASCIEVADELIRDLQ
jgi:hypothetical protein